MTPGVDLSPREAEVLSELAGHATNVEIAARLFISVRTVESHVASLLRKTDAADRRALAALAASIALGAAPAHAPSPASSFVGREAELAELGGALASHRLVTALGPGGIGKTRLALALASRLRAGFEDGDCYVDLVPVTEPKDLASAIAAALGVGDQQARTPEQSVTAWLASRRLLLQLDNCEHLLDAVAELLERVLVDCPRVVVLATSRARLGLPDEWVYTVPGLSTDPERGADAERLFTDRAIAAGADPSELDAGRIERICRALEGSALAIELAAARVPTLGLDGIEDGLVSDALRLLMSGRTTGGRHRSLRATLQWSADLLPPSSRTLLDRVSVFAGRFSATAAEEVLAGWDPEVPSMRGALAELADQSLLVARPTMRGMRYRALETVRQFGRRELVDSGEADDVRARHLRWCAGRADALPLPLPDDVTEWRRDFDELADDARSAIGWAASCSKSQDEGRALAGRFGALCFARGRPAEAQRMFELAAELDPSEHAIDWLDSAAGCAEIRHFGNDAMRLRRRAADRAVELGRPDAAAWQLARSAELVTRAPGIMTRPPQRSTAAPLIAEARRLGAADEHALTRILIAEASITGDADPDLAPLVAVALDAARAAGDPLAESAALDHRCIVDLVRGDLPAAAADSARRVELLEAIELGPDTGLEYPDALLMGAETACGVGDLGAATRYAETMLALPTYAEEPHLAVSRILMTTAFEGDFAACAAFAARFLEGWDRAGRQGIGSLALSAWAAASAEAMLGRTAAADDWDEIARDMRRSRGSLRSPLSWVFSAVPLLHRGEWVAAADGMVDEIDDAASWVDALWGPWYLAHRCEASVLAAHPDAADRVADAPARVAPNPIAAALVARARALLGDRTELIELAARFDALGCRYQAARTRVMAGDPAGARWMQEAGLVPMHWPLSTAEQRLGPGPEESR